MSQSRLGSIIFPPKHPPPPPSLITSNMDSENDTESPFPSPSSSCKRKAGRTKFKETRHPVYRGVRRRNGDKWVCEVREPDKKSRIWLGTYPTPEMAATAHDAAVLFLRGSSALLNFPDSASLLPLATSSSPSDIRAAAATAATTLLRPYSNIRSSSSSSPHDNTNKSVEDSSMMSGERSKNIMKNEEFMDEEALYNMPALLDSMAEGLLLPPPSMIRASDEDIAYSHGVDLNLWTH